MPYGNPISARAWNNAQQQRIQVRPLAPIARPLPHRHEWFQPREPLVKAPAHRTLLDPQPPWKKW